MALHSEQEVWDACEALLVDRGPAALRREVVQEELKRRAEQAGREPKGVSNAMVGRIIREVLKKHAQAREAAREADLAQAAGGDVPHGVLELVTQFGETLGATIRTLIREVQRRAEMEPAARVAAAEREASGRVAELAGEVESLRSEHDTLVADHAQTNEALDERDEEVARLAASLREREAVMEIRDAEARRRVAELEPEVRAANGGRLAAEARAHAAELAQSRAESEVALVEGRLAAERSAREEWVRWAARHEERASAAEAHVEELRVRLALAGARGGEVGHERPGAGRTAKGEARATAPLGPKKPRSKTRQERV